MSDRLALIEARWREAGCGDGDKAWLIAELRRRAAPDALVKAAIRLLHACDQADGDGELPEHIDGVMLDNLRAALRPVERGEEGA